MALSLTPTAVQQKRKKVATTNLQAEQQQVANPQALQQKPAVVAQKPAVAPAIKAPAAPSPPRETSPAPTMTAMSNAPPLPSLDTTKKPSLPSAAERAPTPSFPVQPSVPTQRHAAASGPTIGPKVDMGGAANLAESLSGQQIQDNRSALQKAVDAKKAAEEASPSNALDQQIQSLLSDIVAGNGMNVDTSEEEALIRQLMQDQIGQGLVEQRARMGRAGFGASGALAAMEGDVRRQAGQQATQETLALRRQAEQEAIQNALNAIGVDVTKRKEGRQEVFDQELLNALKSSLGQEDTSGPKSAGESNIAKRASEQFGDAGDQVKDIISKQGVGAVPEALGATWDAMVKTLYGENANPADYSAAVIPIPPFVVPMPTIGGAESNPITQIGGAISSAASNLWNSLFG